MARPNINAAVDKMIEELKTVTGMAEDDLLPFAVEFAPAAALWAQKGDAAALEELEALAVGKAAVHGINAQAAGEQFFKDLLAMAGEAAKTIA